ncbi:hypothetical protein EMPG_09647 [Blastomyces silverae]|uniref:tyrosinase n=1 Tax=Blastomyces silverae TaxID=2060906 RepID=A0A0H1BRE8_9EURO|nr:hypothetical protein EMPG_09647 [Blastomyces silverae]
MSYKYYPIQGIEEGLGPGNQVPIRREFNEWSTSQVHRDQIQVVLFLLALNDFQAIPPDSRDSYFQIAGIHGMPYKSWDEPGLTTQETHRKGYCVHANSLFPIWHRPYLLLYEQRIYEMMVDVVIPRLRLPGRVENEWLEAAYQWRLPFWDWAKYPTIPQLMCKPRIRLRFPEMTIYNPLYKFKMPNGKRMSVYGLGTLKSPDLDPALEVRYGECCATSRCPTRAERVPTSKEWRDGVVNTEAANKFMTNHESITDFDYGKTTEMVYRLLTYPMDFVSFATTARDATMDSSSASKVTNDMNIEFIHNNIHYWVGGDGGHMSQIPVATFDPIFWFHHCFLDRLFAIWQTLNPKKWFNADKTRPFDQEIIGMGNIVTSNAPLRPFHMDEQGTVWTPDGVRDWFTLGYTYPELQRWNYGDNYREELFRDVNDTYGVLRKEAIAMAAPDSKLPGVVQAGENGVSMNDYAVSIRYSKFAMDGHPFNLEVYLRPENETKNTFRPEDFVTSVYNFSQPAEQNGETVCSNCNDLEEQDVQVIAYIPITPYLIKKIEQQVLRSLTRATIERFLSGLYYRVTMSKQGDNVVAEERWKPSLNLKVTVSQTRMEYSNDPSIPTTFEDPQIIPSLGISPEAAGVPAATPGVSANYVPFNGITQLKEAVPTGGSLVITAQSASQDKPRGDIKTGISLASLESGSSNEADQQTYDVLLCIVIRSGSHLLSCSSKQAGRGFSATTDLTLEPWLKKDEPSIRVDIGANDFIVYVDGRRFLTVERAIKSGNITHVRYWTFPPRDPVFAGGLTVTTYKQVGLVP